MVRCTPDFACGSFGTGAAATAATGTFSGAFSGGGVTIAMGFAGLAGSFDATAGAAAVGSGFFAFAAAGSGSARAADATGSFFAAALQSSPGSGSGGGSFDTVFPGAAGRS